MLLLENTNFREKATDLRSERLRLCSSQISQNCSIIFRMLLYLQLDHSFPYHFNLNFPTITRRDSSSKVTQSIIWFTLQLIKTYKCSKDTVCILKFVCFTVGGVCVDLFYWGQETVKYI